MVNSMTVGALVVLTDEYISLTERFELRSVLCEIIDTRLANGVYVYAVAPVSGAGFLTESFGVFPEDIRLARV